MAYLERHGVRLYYESHGDQTDPTPLLLTHGYSASSAMWTPNLRALAEKRRVITWDMRGHGRSDSPRDPARYTEEREGQVAAERPSAGSRSAATCPSRS